MASNEIASDVPPLASPKPASPGLNPEQLAALGNAIHKLALDPTVQETFRSIGKGIQTVVASIRPVASFIGSALVGLGRIMEQLPEQLQKAVLALSARGWFFDQEATLADYWKAQAFIASGDTAAADALMSAHFESRIDEIEAALCERLPHRADKFRNALAAHRRGEFDLSVLAFLAQADGVCKELRGGHFFLMDRLTRKPEAAPYAEAFSDTFLNQILHMALIEQIPLKHQMSKRGFSESGILNRHAVMHGESLDYDTKDNSLRALSLLNYVAIALDKKDPERPLSPLDTAIRATAASISSPHSVGKRGH
ncbi:hypothetical protein [Polaromonas sp.]|uniref:hypothetical protein n=1 Tax=Polaromonas sp. TaxID=1869339 RepID=UPI003CC0B576